MCNTINMILQLLDVQYVIFEVTSFDGLACLVFLRGGLKMRLPCTHLQKILYQTHMIFSLVHFATAG
jgi:hypothetical protein